MSAEENMALARRFLEARVAKRDLDAVDEMLTPDFVNHNRLLPGQAPIARVTYGQSLLIMPPSLRAT